MGFEGDYPRSSSMPSLLFTLEALRPKERRALPKVRTRRQASGPNSSCGDSLGILRSHRLVV